jgi:putative intracellular protease/amidase
LLILVGGNSWDTNDELLYSFITNAFNRKIPIGAICGAVDYLARHSFLNKFIHTGNSLEQWLSLDNYTALDKFLTKQAVKDKHLVTANGTAVLEFTELVLKLIDFDTVGNIEKQIYLYRNGYYNYCEKYGSPY